MCNYLGVGSARAWWDFKGSGIWWGNSGNPRAHNAVDIFCNSSDLFFLNIRLYFLLKENSTSMRSLLLFVKTDIHLIQCLLIFFIFYVPDAFQFSVLQNISESVIITIKILSNIKIQKYNFYFSDVRYMNMFTFFWDIFNNILTVYVLYSERTNIHTDIFLCSFTNG